MIFSNKQSRGFTILETTIAVAVLILAIVGPMALAGQSIRAQGLAKDNIMAANLAQEGIELIRNVRANNFLSWSNNNVDLPSGRAHWMDGILGGTCDGANGCKIDSENMVLSACLSSGCGELNINSNPSSVLWGLYSYDGPDANNIKSGFTRTIKVTSVRTDEVKVTSSISWKGIFGAKSLTVETLLLNWP